jgi:hypothetical protein
MRILHRIKIEIQDIHYTGLPTGLFYHRNGLESLLAVVVNRSARRLAICFSLSETSLSPEVAATVPAA